MKLIKIASLIACGLMLTLSQGLAKDPVNTKCPIKGKAVDSKSKMVDVEVTFCCKKCKATFDKDVLAGLQKFAAAADGKCPISGKDVDTAQKSTASVGACCNGCKKKVTAEPKKHLAKIE
jgi:endogenous inhibitor of DNA gyrase (YacG/DUF329 family)